MLVRFWGTRGSIPVPGRKTVKYGGNTPCVQLESEDVLIIFDAGTGIRSLGRSLMKRKGGRPIEGHILLSHTHWDHIQGFPFFAPAFAQGNRFAVYGCEGASKRLEDILAGQMGTEYFPVTLSEMGSEIEFVSVGRGSFRIGPVEVVTEFMNHPGLCLGYRVSSEGRTVVYTTDNEPYFGLLSMRRGERGNRDLTEKERASLKSLDEQTVQFIRDADLLIADTHWTLGEYKHKLGWGHGSVDHALEIALQAGVRQLALFHHSPTRSDAQIDAVVKRCRQKLRRMGADLKCFAAREGLKVVL